MKGLRREYLVIKGEMSARKEKWKNAISGKQMNSVQEDIPVVFNHVSHSGLRAQSSSSTSRAPTQTDGITHMAV